MIPVFDVQYSVFDIHYYSSKILNNEQGILNDELLTISLRNSSFAIHFFRTYTSTQACIEGLRGCNKAIYPVIVLQQTIPYLERIKIIEERDIFEQNKIVVIVFDTITKHIGFVAETYQRPL